MSDEQRDALRRVIDQWIESGARTYEPAIGALARLQGNPLPDVAVYDDAFARAGGEPPVSQLYLERSMLLLMDDARQADHVGDLERAYKFADTDDMRSNTAGALAQHHASLDDYEKAIPFMYEAIEKCSEEATVAFYRGMLAGWLEKRGDTAASIAIRTELATSDPAERHRQLRELVQTHLKSGDRAAAEAACNQMTEPGWTTVEAWLDFVWDETDETKIRHAMRAIAPGWDDLIMGRRWIQNRMVSARTSREQLVPFFEETFLPIANAGLEESRAIEDQLLGQPDGFLVLADELTRRGDPRGELIVVQHQLEREPDNTVLQQRAQQLIDENSIRFCGPVDTFKGRWHRGYVRAGQLDVLEMLGDIALVMAHPSLRFLEELTILVARNPTDALLAAAPSLRRLTKLVVRIWRFTDEQRATLEAALPNIEFA